MAFRFSLHFFGHLPLHNNWLKRVKLENAVEVVVTLEVEQELKQSVRRLSVLDLRRESGGGRVFRKRAFQEIRAPRHSGERKSKSAQNTWMTTITGCF